MNELGLKPEDVIVDLHVVRIALQLGITQGSNRKNLEKQLMEQIDPKDWGKAGMAICFLGRETCRPTKPKCEECVMVKVCAHTKTL
ncbi:MAG: hypothetical protein IM606_09720 [Cytophagales bacterium]|jgi:endonuclease-3|nr:hypothetical protein [Cytophagales bacterium]MCA6391339.1 hypothetical protein [Cytophagales bacterium]MCA6395454.1 hypothetical protein [Cytophagales bacterium]MCA6398693.1 hypothetical protein [Cytophagales bacterium]MCA6403816.1 hypothetical protein [Cytophagales bacterium]